MKLPSDTKSWIVIGLFLIAQEIFGLIAFRPNLSANTLFVTLATLVIGSGGLLLCVSFYFGSSQSSATKDATITAMSATAGAQAAVIAANPPESAIGPLTPVAAPVAPLGPIPAPGQGK